MLRCESVFDFRLLRKYPQFSVFLSHHVLASVTEEVPEESLDLLPEGEARFIELTS